METVDVSTFGRQVKIKADAGWPAVTNYLVMVACRCWQLQVVLDGSSIVAVAGVALAGVVAYVPSERGCIRRSFHNGGLICGRWHPSVPQWQPGSPFGSSLYHRVGSPLYSREMRVSDGRRDFVTDQSAPGGGGRRCF